MMRRALTRRGFTQLAAGAMPASAASPQPPAPKPNVLWIMADQLRFDCLGVNGNKLIQTPNIDRIAARSANFQKTFVQAPVCVPSRASCFTGRYPHSHKNRVNYTPLDGREQLIQKMFQEGGYQTASVGKLHFHPPTAEHARSTGFDHVRLDDGVNATDPYSDYVAWRKANDPMAAKVHYHATVPSVPTGRNPFRAAIEYPYTPTAWTGAETRKILGDLRSGQKPFFLFSSFFKPHSPHSIPEPYDSMYDIIEIPLPRRVTLPDIHKLPLPVQKQILRGKPHYDMDRERLQWIYRSYYAGVTMVDREIGQILEGVDLDNTIVLITSDHGDQLLEHGLEGKNVFFESSVRVPFLISWPGHIRTGKRRELIEMVDVLPTLLDLCGLPARKSVQGRSFASLIAAQQNGAPAYRAREFVFSENVIPEVITNRGLNMYYAPGEGVGGILNPDAKMLRTERYKLNHYVGHGGELYDLQEDPGETRNLYGVAAHQPMVREMRDRLLDFLITADEPDQIAPHWLVR
ncbi:MAG: sulfatase-like hydrolase/transferase [Bryobacterales bacterium]|nr:sulfatase-like hydrolase/transferase [Bryobacterales bacterium]